MSIVIYSYHNPYSLKDNQELWDEIVNCPYFCVSQTLVNGLKTLYGKDFQINRVTTVKNLTDAVYRYWTGTACAVKQHADIDNIISMASARCGLNADEVENIRKSFLFNKEIGDVLDQKDVLFHVDATQSCGKLVDEIRSIKYNMLSFSAHKLMGPQGVGVLVLRKKKYKLPPVRNIMYGGQQEHGIRPGTIPVALVAGCGMACEIANKEYKDNAKKAVEIKKAMIQELNASGIEYSINGDPEFCVDTTINVSLKGVSSEALMISTKQFCGVSNGSACTSKSYSPSYVLRAMGIENDTIESSLRISWGAGTNKNEAIEDIRELLSVAKQFNS